MSELTTLIRQHPKLAQSILSEAMRGMEERILSSDYYDQEYWLDGADEWEGPHVLRLTQLIAAEINAKCARIVREDCTKGDRGMRFNVGDKVKWTSQAGSYEKKKVGEVIEIIQAGSNPQDALHYQPGWGSLPRKEESYIVAVGNKFYWPRTVHLRRVKP